MLIFYKAIAKSKEPIAPQPAASVGVAKPNKILPSEANTKAAGGTKPIKNSTQTSFILVAKMLSKVPRGRFLEIEEFTSLICWLSSEENSFSTAAVFDISGGRSTY
jgi:NAD(P)-dependent dehydrogenase (short-subunit alcohol dehydrogenase family)